MPATAIVHGHTAVELKPAPIRPEWIEAGDPVARNAVLSRSADGMATTMVWACTPGVFTWRYHIDETIHLLEGSVVMEDGAAPPRRLGPGDVVFFPAGAAVRWTVETPVRKLAFFRRQIPMPLGLVTRAGRDAKDRLKARRAGRPPAEPALHRAGA
ncbi:cupin domain-containing protein [Lichenibacterium dinghuense]|uniref:cupin domain-containing protein n=1 Tax=Lichenibacterium dinghuense TaxID=2895977 RepID=UPI001F3A4DB9|nr:cupin domain-containing protein [Lichenibacterium sp. 6Y81]